MLNGIGLLALFSCFIITFLIALKEQIPVPTIPEIKHSQSLVTKYSDPGLISPSMSIEQFVVLFWMLGVLVFLIRFVIGSYSIFQIRNASFRAGTFWQDKLEDLKNRIEIRSTVKLFCSRQIMVPIVVGIFKPIIICPLIYFNEMTAEEFESILIHELVHIKRLDFFFNLIVLLMESFLFFNPATWWMTKQLKRNREYCCDDEVQNNLSNHNSYLKALYKVALHSTKFQATSIALINNKSELTMRVKRMLNMSADKLYFKPILSTVSLCVMAFVLYSFQNNPTSTDSLTLNNLITENKQTESKIPLNQLSETKASHIVKTIPAGTGENDLLEEIKKVEGVSYYNIELSDTLPTNPRIVELEKLLEQKSDELDELSDQLSDEMEGQIEIDVERIEDLAEKLEDLIEPRIEVMEEEMSKVDFERMEALGDLFEDKIEDRMEILEEEIEEGVMEELENLMDELSDKMDDAMDEDEDTEANQKEIKKIQQEMEVVQKKMEFKMQDFHKAQQEIMNDSEIIQIQKEMEALSKEGHKMQINHDDIWDEETKAIQEEINVIQKQIEVKMNKLSSELTTQINEKAKEIDKIARELEEERRIQRIKDRRN